MCSSAGLLQVIIVWERVKQYCGKRRKWQDIYPKKGSKYCCIWKKCCLSASSFFLCNVCDSVLGILVVQLTHYHTMRHFDALKIVRKGEIACNKQFLIFTQCFHETSSLWLWKENCDSTGVRKPGNTCVSPIAMIWPQLLKWCLNPNTTNQLATMFSILSKVFMISTTFD